MKVFEEVYEDELPAGTHVMSGRWVASMKTPTAWRSKYTARRYEEPPSDDGCFAATATIQGIRMLLARCLDKRSQGHEAFEADYTQAFLNDEVREKRTAVRTTHLKVGHQNCCKTADVWCGECVRPCWVSGHLRDAGKNTCQASCKNTDSFRMSAIRVCS